MVTAVDPSSTMQQVRDSEPTERERPRVLFAELEESGFHSDKGMQKTRNDMTFGNDDASSAFRQILPVITEHISSPSPASEFSPLPPTATLHYYQTEVLTELNMRSCSLQGRPLQHFPYTTITTTTTPPLAPPPFYTPYHLMNAIYYYVNRPALAEPKRKVYRCSYPGCKKSLHQELQPEGAPVDTHWGEAF